MEPDFVSRLIIVALVIYGTSLHELGHAYVATWLGDPTPGRHGRLTLNPIPHLDPLLTAVILPLVLYMTGGYLMCLALTPIDPSRFRRPLRDHMLVAVAGPVMNFLLMGVMVAILWIPGLWKFDEYGRPTYNMIVLFHAAYWNLILGLFNLMPIPPLDGYWIVRPLLPLSLRRSTDELARMGMMSLALVMIGGRFLFPYIQAPAFNFFMELLPWQRY